MYNSSSAKTLKCRNCLGKDDTKLERLQVKPYICLGRYEIWTPLLLNNLPFLDHWFLDCRLGWKYQEVSKGSWCPFLGVIARLSLCSYCIIGWRTVKVIKLRHGTEEESELRYILSFHTFNSLLAFLSFPPGYSPAWSPPVGNKCYDHVFFSPVERWSGDQHCGVNLGFDTFFCVLIRGWVSAG